MLSKSFKMFMHKKVIFLFFLQLCQLYKGWRMDIRMVKMTKESCNMGVQKDI